MFNPFDLPGPQFLLFYACLGVFVMAAFRYFQRRREEGPLPRIDTSDPYLIAYLRGGKNEAVRLATVSLIDRGLIKDEGTDRLVTAGSEETVRRPIEKAVMALFSRPQPAEVIFKAHSVQVACREFESHLTRRGFMADEAVRAQRRALLGAALAILFGIAGIKVFVALGGGHTNIAFLLIMATAFTIVCVKVAKRPRTRRGDLVLEDLRRLFARLRARAPAMRSGGATAEAVLLAAVFGIAALPSPAFAYAHRLFRKSANDTSGSSCGGSSCGSSCGGGGSGGDSGGGGCGGCGGGGGGD